MEVRLDKFTLPTGASGYDVWSRRITDDLIPERQRNLRLQPALIRLTKGLTDEGRSKLTEAIRNEVIGIEGSDAADLREYFGLDTQTKLDTQSKDDQHEKASPKTQGTAKEGPSVSFGGIDSDRTVHVYWREKVSEEVLKTYAEYFDILELGDPLESDGAPVAPLVPPEPEILPDDAAIVAVIDDGIGFLNTRFRRDKFHTRFHAIWLQSRRQVSATPYGKPHPNGGIVLYRQDIDAILALGDTLIEGDIYRQINQALLPVSPLFPNQHPSLEFSFTHGSHVADLAAGDDPVAPGAAHDWALIGVQLPPDAVNQTAGWYLAQAIPRGVRWLLQEAGTCSAGAHVNINLSFAAFAGPKNGTGLVEAQISHDLKVWQATTGRRAQISYAFGNNRLTRMAADYTLKGKLEKLDWQLQPDNRESAFMEIHASPPGELPRLAFEVVIPGVAGAIPLAPIAQNTGLFIVDVATNKPIAMFLHAPPLNTAPGVTQPAHYLFAVAPTHEHAPAVAPAGTWNLRLQNGDPKPAKNSLAVRLEIQRGDTPTGYPRAGRQSYFDHPDAHEWEAISLANTLTNQSSYGLTPPVACPITRFGTHSAYVTANSEATLSVAAMRGDPRSAPAIYIAAPYSALGSPTLGTAPDVAAYGDRSAGRRGLIASGNFSGGGRTSDGTSAAAAVATRVAVTVTQTAAPPPPLLNPGDKATFLAALVPAHGDNTNPADGLSLGKVAIFDATGSGIPIWLDPARRLT